MAYFPLLIDGRLRFCGVPGSTGILMTVLALSDSESDNSGN